jgi:leader peptidase (prepilin peptidase)/N-methyltransferase
VNGLGGGDPKLLGALGLWTGWVGLPTLLLAGCLLGLADALRRIRCGAAAGTVQLPFGCYLAIATIVFALWKLSGLNGF